MRIVCVNSNLFENKYIYELFKYCVVWNEQCWDKAEIISLHIGVLYPDQYYYIQSSVHLTCMRFISALINKSK